MPALPEPPSAIAQPLHFACGHCGTVLSVPAALAGIQGPCPSCRHLVVAPSAPLPTAPLPVASGWNELATPPLGRPKHLVPQPRIQKPAAPPEPDAPPPPAPAAKRSSLRRRNVTESAEPATQPEAAAPRGRPTRSSPVSQRSRLAVDDAEGPSDRISNRASLWTWAGMGAVFGGGVVFAGLSAWQLKRDISPAPASPPARLGPTAPGRDGDAVAALAAHKQASARELKSLLASQQIVWLFFSAASADEARPLVAEESPTPLPASGLHTTLTGLSLRSKHRLPDEAGLASQWSVSTARFGELVVDVSDASGQPKINWAKLATQLNPGSDHRTAAAP